MNSKTRLPSSAAQLADPAVDERVQTGVRIQKRLLKVLKALAEYLDLSLGDLLEGIVLHSLESKPPFGEKTLAQIARFKEIYGLSLDASASHQFWTEDELEATASAHDGPLFPEDRDWENKEGETRR